MHRYQTLRRKLFSEITTIPEIFQPSYFHGLDGLRAISIIIVILSHLLKGTVYENYFSGNIGVDIFYVISGFLITTLLLKEKVNKGRISLRHFYIRRVLRIFPVAYLYLACLLLLNYISNLHTTLRMFLTAGLYIGNFPVHYGQNWQTAHFWSLAVEEQFYLFFPFVLARSLNGYLLLVLFLLILLPFIVFCGELPLSSYPCQLLHYLITGLKYLLGYGTSSILIGSITSILIFKKIIPTKPGQPYLLSGIIFLIAIILHLKNVTNWNILIFAFPILISYVILLNLESNNFFSKILNHHLLVKIGVFSYSIYIWQQLFTYDQPWKHTFKYSGSAAFNLVALIVVAWISYTQYEKRFLKLKKHFA